MAKTTRKRTRDYRQENAARRYRRQAATAKRQAAKAEGMQRQKLLARAEYLESQVKYTYKNPSADFTGTKEQWGRRRERAIRESQVAKLSRNEKRELQAKQILRTGNIGSRFFAGTVQIWDTEDEVRLTPQQIHERITDYFQVDTYMDVLEELEDAGIDIYSDAENSDRYDEFAIRIMGYVSRRNA